VARHRFFYLLNLARHRVHKRADRLCQERLGVSGAQLGALFVVVERPGLRQREVADALGYNESAITALTHRMIDADLLERRPDPDDGRVSLVFATAHGNRVVARARPVLAELNARLTGDFCDAELDVAARFLEHAIASFSEEEP
jgi:DNA-binding MarR family transcriptional regulator